jgi:molybdopterin-dependent oxidoreductase alpha subunit
MADDEAAGGIASIAHTALHAVRAGLSRSLPALRVVNQADGFDCPGCAWPESAERGAIEFCENGAKAVAHEATTRTLTREFWLSWPVSALREQPHRWLEAQGRLVEPLWLQPGAEHFVPVSWNDAFARCGAALRGLASPDQAVFYTSGRTSNEAAFLYQLFVRAYGTNNLPDCSNLCHESSGVGLGEMIGIGKGTVSLADFALADLILVIGQNPGSNHPRMLTTLQQAVRGGCRIVSVNPLRERGLVRFRHPQEVSGLLGSGTKLAERFVRVRVGGDIALLKGVMKELLALEAERGGVLDRAFLAEYTSGFEGFAKALDAYAFDDLEAGSGVPRREMRELAELYAGSQRTIACWAMGLTQHRHGVGNVQEVMNLLLLRGNIGRPGAGPCPVRGHSNVQGDRTMGIWERPRPAFLDALEREFGIRAPRRPGLSTIEAIRAMADGSAQVFVGLGGNFAVASPDSARVEQALNRQDLSVHVATKLNRSHLLGREVLVLPCLGRSERDVQRSGAQFVTVEDSMAQVHRSQGRLAPVTRTLASEVAIVAGLARATLGDASRVPWEELAADYDRIRERIARVVPGCEDMNTRVRRPGGFTLPRPPAERRFETPSGRAELREVPLPRIEVPAGRLLLMTVRSHDQYNTTIYGDDDRYRGIRGDRRVVFVNPDDLRTLGLAAGDAVDVTSHTEGAAGEPTRTLRGFRLVAYEIPRGCAAAYFPEANPLVPLEHHAAGSLTPAYKSVVISLAPAKVC